MFVNTINAGEFDKMHEFVRTFMLPNCPFGSKVLMGDNFDIPAVLHSVGPCMHVHYLLGCFVMYPDLVLTLNNSQIVTSNTWAGSKIVIQMECRMTQTYRVPDQCWNPPPDKVEQMHAEPSIERMMAALCIEDSARSYQGGAVSHSVLVSAKDPAKKRQRRTLAAQPDATPLVPMSFVRALHEGAVLVKDPQLIHLRGEYTIMLDEQYRIQSIALVVMPVVS